MKKISKCRQLKYRFKEDKGFTLVEVLLAVSISLLLMGSLYAVYLTSYKSYKKNVAKAELNQNARIAMERITRDLRQTDRIVTILPPDDTDILNPPPKEIQFQDGHVTNKIQYLKYFLSSGNLKKQVIHYYFSSDPATWVAWNAQDQYGNLPIEAIDEDTIRADKINDIKFYGNKLITIDLVASDSNGSYNYKTEILGRNIQ